MEGVKEAIRIALRQEDKCEAEREGPQNSCAPRNDVW